MSSTCSSERARQAGLAATLTDTISSVALRSLHPWWNRPCGGREVLALAGPLVISTISFAVMTFIDRMFLTHFSVDAVAAAMPAAMLQFTLISFPLGVATYVNTFVAQYEGAGRPRQIGPIVWQGVWIAVAAIPLLLLTAPLAHAFFHHAGHNPDVVVNEITYYDVLIYGSGAVILAGTLSSFFTGRGATRVVMIVDPSAALLNGVLAYCWIFGHGGFPRGHRRGRGGDRLRETARVLGYVAVMASLATASIICSPPGGPAAICSAGCGLSPRRAVCNGSSNAARSRFSSRSSAGWAKSRRPPRCWPSTSTASPGCR